MAATRPFSQALERLKRHGLRPTRQRLALVKVLFEKGDRHLTADQLHAEAAAAGVRVSLATVYNTLNQFTAAGLLREVVVATGRAYFDTNTTEHHHAIVETTGELLDIAATDVRLEQLPPLPEGMTLRRVDVILRLARIEDRKITK
ncbi:MAG: transcriptional repressor [Alphaproteobacteria bacterium]|nr:transcriptional repressor [Alphaproteobacteria bacterium]